MTERERILRTLSRREIEDYSARAGTWPTKDAALEAMDRAGLIAEFVRCPDHDGNPGWLLIGLREAGTRRRTQLPELPSSVVWSEPAQVAPELLDVVEETAA
jgi:hypothetical protein